MMTNYEKIIDGLRACVSYEYPCPDCPYHGDDPGFDECSDALHAAAANAIGELQDALGWKEHFDVLTAQDCKMPRWVPVTERLPEPCETVIVYTVFGNYGQMSEITFAHTMKIFDQITWNRAGVTHWMPLPEPPKECE